ncbi:hypothetical protein [Azospirillum sp.]|uniref:hypothetical protein n=1 Tax=Azospirillum sp. TaxID=34012 RepID=UPI003D71E7E3
MATVATITTPNRRAGLMLGMERGQDGSFSAVLGITINRGSRRAAEDLAAIEAPNPVTARPRPTLGLGRYIDLFV